MKRILSIFTLLLFFLIGNSATYYIKNAGNDANTGLSDAQAWTFTKLATFTPASGDRILFNKGEIFYGTLTLKRSATSGSPVTYGAYGTGAKPVITSLKTLSGWVLHSAGIYKVTGANIPTNCDIVTIDGVQTPMGQYPSTGYNVFESFTGRTSFVDNQLTGTPNFNGAEVVIVKSNWTIDRSVVTNQSTSTITYTSGSSYNPEATGGYKYFFQKDIDCLLKMGDWYTDGTDFYMYFGANTPSSYVVKAGSSDYTIYQDRKNYNTVRDLKIEGGNLYAIQSISSVAFNLRNCDVINTGQSGLTVIYNGITGASTYTAVDSCSFSYTGGSAIVMVSDNGSVKNSTFNYCGKYAGLGAPEGGSHYGIGIRGTNCVTEYNVVTNTGYIPINFYGNNSIVRYNKVDTYPTLGLNDGGGIYTYYGKEDNAQSGMKVYSNTVANSTANGLYADNLSNNQEWYDNVVYNVDGRGMHMNMPVYNYIHDNVFYDCGNYALSVQNLTSQTTTASNTTISNNTIIQKNASDGLFSLKDGRSNQTLSVPFGTSNNNTFVADNSATTVFYNSYVTPSYHTDSYTLANWKTFTGLEASSTYTLKDVSTITFLYNDTKTAKSFAITGSKTDLGGVNVYQTSVTIQPFKSLLLLPITVSNESGYTKILKHNGVALKYNNKMIVVP